MVLTSERLRARARARWRNGSLAVPAGRGGGDRSRRASPRHAPLHELLVVLRVAAGNADEALAGDEPQESLEPERPPRDADGLRGEGRGEAREREKENSERASERGSEGGRRSGRPVSVLRSHTRTQRTAPRRAAPPTLTLEAAATCLAAASATVFSARRMLCAAAASVRASFSRAALPCAKNARARMYCARWKGVGGEEAGVGSRCHMEGEVN